MGKSAIQRIKELDAERAKLLEQAKEEALRKASEAVAELNALGFNYQLTIAKRRKSGTEKELEIRSLASRASWWPGWGDALALRQDRPLMRDAKAGAVDDS